MSVFNLYIVTCHVKYTEMCIAYVITCTDVEKYDFALKMGILYIDFHFVYVEDPKADELSLIGFTFVK